MKKENVEFVQNPIYDIELFNKRITVTLDRWDIRNRPEHDLNFYQLQQKKRIEKQTSELAVTGRYGI